jgi:hypothetical protein
MIGASMSENRRDCISKTETPKTRCSDFGFWILDVSIFSEQIV